MDSDTTSDTDSDMDSDMDPDADSDVAKANEAAILLPNRLDTAAKKKQGLDGAGCVTLQPATPVPTGPSLLR